MKKILFVLTLFVTSFSYALHIECVGNAVLLTNDGDTLLLFENNPEVKTLPSVGIVDWYRLPDTITPMQTGTDYFYPEHGGGYMVKKGDVRDVFWVFDYDSLRAQVSAIQANLSCTQTELVLDGVVPAMQYQNLRRQTITYPRQCRVTYMDAQWSDDNERWVDSLAIAEKEFTATISLDPSPVPTDFVIADMLADLLDIAADSLYSDVYQPIALKAHPQAIVTTRGKPGERTNEVERPSDPETLIKRSAPLIVTFRANGLNADHYDWRIRKGTEEIIQRADAQHEYTFSEPGNYTVLVGISNSYGCALDTVTFDVAVSASMLVVPNVFTPNGDGTHDEFRVVYRSIKEFHCWVYNRLGHQVFYSNNPDKGWDGTIHGRPAAEGAYYYVIRALGTDAESDYMAKPKYTKKLKKGEQPLGVYQLSGDINLLRGGK